MSTEARVVAGEPNQQPQSMAARMQAATQAQAAAATQTQQQAPAGEPLVRELPPPPSRIVSMKAAVGENTQVQEFLVPELIPAHDIALLIGEDGIGKTNLAAQLCCDIMFNHNTFLNAFELRVKHKRCLFVATEDSLQRFRGAITKQMLGMYPAIDLKNPEAIPGDFGFIDASDYYDWDDFIAGLLAEVAADAYDLIVADALSDLFTYVDGEINSNSHARRILADLKHICKEKNTTLLLLHHAAKTKITAKQKDGKLFLIKNDSQGAGAITQKPRTVLALTHEPGSIQDEPTDQNAPVLPFGHHEEQLSTHINFLHVVKANLMGRKYMRNAVAARFTGSSLLHQYLGTYPLTDFEGESAATNLETLRGKQVMKPKDDGPDSIPMDVHITKISRLFAMVDFFDGEQIITAIEYEYGVSGKRAEKEFRPWLKAKGLLVFTVDKVWRNGIEAAPF